MIEPSKIYVHCGTYDEFKDFERENSDYECIYITDGITLRGRYPGKVIRVGTYYNKWNDQEIEESIAIHEDLWKDHEKAESEEISKDSKDMLGYGV
jgi:hypothetical protein